MKENGDLLSKLVIQAATLDPSNKVFESGFRIQTQRSEYYFEQSKIVEGDYADVFFGFENNPEKTKVVLKLFRDPLDDDLARNEIRALQILKKANGPQIKHIPIILDQFKNKDQQVNIIMQQVDGYDLKAIRSDTRYRCGVPDYHMAWILCRLLSVMGYAHKNGIIHGNIEPTHIIVQPQIHNVILLDWTCSVFDPAHTNETFKVYNPDYGAPEVPKKTQPLPSADIYSAGKSMEYLLDYDQKTDAFPKLVDERIENFIKHMLLKSPLQRGQDAWELHNQLENLRTEIWGTERFQEFYIN